MANRTVEFISDQYGKMIFANAASESTMRDLMNAFSDLEDEINDGGGGAGPGNSFVSGIKKESNKIKNLSNKVEKWGRTTARDFANLMEKGSNKTSEWASALNNNFVKKVPIVGETMGELAGALITAVQVFEGWNDVLQQTSKVGASFGNSITELRRSAAEAHMDLDSYAALLAQNSRKLAEVGGTVTQGAKIFNRYTKVLWEGKNSLASDLLNLGLSVDDVGQRFMFYYTNVIRSTDSSKMAYKKQTESFAEYTKYQQMITMMTGKNNEQQQQGVMESMKNDAFRLSLEQGSESRRNKMLKALTLADAVFGEAGRDYVVSAGLGQKEMSVLGRQLGTFSPNSKAMLEELLALADSSTPPAEFSKASEVIMAKYIPGINKDIEALKNQLNATSTNYEGLDDMVKSTEGVRAFLNNFGAVNGMTSQQVKDRIAKILAEMNKQEAFTAAMNEMTVTIRKFKDEVMIRLTPYFEQIGVMLSKYKFNEKIETYSKGLNKLFLNVFNTISTILSVFSDDSTNSIMKRQMEMLAQRLYLYVKLAGVRLAFGDSVMGNVWADRINRDINALERRREALPSMAALSNADPAKSNLVEMIDINGGRKTIARGDLYKNLRAADKDGMEIDSIVVVDGLLTISMRKKPGIVDRMTRTGQYNQPNVKQGDPIRAAISGIIRYKSHGAYPYDYISAEIENEDGTVKAVYRIMGPGNAIASGTNPPQSNRQLMETLKDSKVMTGDLIGAYADTWLEGARIPLPPTRPVLDINGESFSKGTLGEYGNLFRQFGSGTLAVLHNEEAVTTPAQQSSLMMKAGQFIAAEFVVNLNSNVKTLISLTKDELDLERAKVRALASARV